MLILMNKIILNPKKKSLWQKLCTTFNYFYNISINSLKKNIYKQNLPLQQLITFISNFLSEIIKKYFFINTYVSSVLILNYNLFLLSIILLLSISFNLFDNSQAYCVKKELLKSLIQASEMSCPGSFIKILANNSFNIRDLPYSDVKPLLNKGSVFHE